MQTSKFWFNKDTPEFIVRQIASKYEARPGGIYRHVLLDIKEKVLTIIAEEETRLPYEDICLMSHIHTNHFYTSLPTCNYEIL